MGLSKRLETCLRYTDGFNHLADIGTDHAQLPIEAIKRGYVLDALAIDNKEGPYVIAFANVKKHNLQDRIKVVLSDGLEKINENTDVCVIAGMGGELITNIMTKHSLKNIKRFIIQPNNHVSKIRQILPSIGFYIKDELILEDQNKIYEILILERGTSNLTEDEIEFGRYNLKTKPFYFLKKCNQEIIQLEYILSQVSTEEEKQKIENDLKKRKELVR